MRTEHYSSITKVGKTLVTATSNSRRIRKLNFSGQSSGEATHINPYLKLTTGNPEADGVRKSLGWHLRLTAPPRGRSLSKAGAQKELLSAEPRIAAMESETTHTNELKDRMNATPLYPLFHHAFGSYLWKSITAKTKAFAWHNKSLSESSYDIIKSFLHQYFQIKKP